MTPMKCDDLFAIEQDLPGNPRRVRSGELPRGQSLRMNLGLDSEALRLRLNGQLGQLCTVRLAARTSKKSSLELSQKSGVWKYLCLRWAGPPRLWESRA